MPRYRCVPKIGLLEFTILKQCRFSFVSSTGPRKRICIHTRHAHYAFIPGMHTWVKTPKAVSMCSTRFGTCWHVPEFAWKNLTKENLHCFKVMKQNLHCSECQGIVVYLKSAGVVPSSSKLTRMVPGVVSSLCAGT